MIEEFHIGRRVALRGGGTLAPGYVVAIDAEGVTVERERPTEEIGPLAPGARVRSRWHHDGDALGRAGDVFCAWIEPWDEGHVALLAACQAEGCSPPAEEQRAREGIDRPRAPATPAAPAEEYVLALVLPRKPWPPS